ncbi:MAG: DUF2239 family protein [bacterium]
MNELSLQTPYVAFVGVTLLVRGPLEKVLRDVKQAMDQGGADPLLIFDEDSGRQVDFNFQGTEREVLDRALPPAQARTPGRPRLGVAGREVTLLPRHWDWLERQPKSVSAVLRDLVEQARKREPDKTRARSIRDALSTVLWNLAGDFENFEEASRALFAADLERFEKMVSAWPADIRVYAVERLEAAARLDGGTARPGMDS